MESECERSGEAASYVLGDLRGQEFGDYRRHLETCAECREEVSLLRLAADAVPLLASAPPEAEDLEAEPEPIRPGIWAHERIEEVTVSKRPVFTPRGVPGGQRATQVARESAARASKQRALFSLASIADPRRRRSARGGSWWQSQLPKPMVIGVAALAVVAVMVLVLTKQSQSINYVHAQSAWQNGAAVLKMEGSQGQLLVVGMPAPPNGDHYELWAIKQGVRTKIPLNASLELNKKGEGGVVVPGDVRSYLALIVYAEPAGGTKSPQGTPYIVANLHKLNAKNS